jgi:hypothetical protein
MSLPQVRQLVLNTLDIGWHASPIAQTAYFADPYVNPAVGVVNNRLTDTTWYRVDLRELIGRETWDSHSKFNVVLRSLVYNAGADFGTNTTTNGENYNDRSVFIMMSGVHWVSNYNIATRNIDPEAILGVYASTNIGTTEGFVQNYYNVGIQTFDKQSGPIVDLRVRFLRTCDKQPQILNNDTSNTAPTNLVHWSCVFDIVPVASSRTTEKSLVTY